MAAFLVVLVVYLALFYTDQPLRWQSLLLLFVPDDLFASWVGGDVSRFGLVDRLPVLLVASVMMAAAYVSGRLAMEWLGVDRGLCAAEVFVFAAGVGLHLLSLYTLAVGLLGGLPYLLIFTLPMIAVLAVAGQRWKRRWFAVATSRGNEPAEEHPKRAARQKTDGWLSSNWLWMAAPFVLPIVLAGMLPPVDFDVREYHLQVPKEWYQQGRIVFLPHNVYGNMPLGAEMHALLGMVLMQGERDWWWGALAGKTVMSLFGPLAALALFAAGRRLVSNTAGVVAALLYISTAWVARVSASGLNEGAVAFYLFLALYAVLLWLRETDSPVKTDSSAVGRHGLLLLGGFLAGAAVACKYPALLFVVLPLTGVVLVGRSLRLASDDFSESRRDGPTRRGVNDGRGAIWDRLDFKSGAVFLLMVALSCGLWLGKNWALTSNPTYPLLYEVFGGKTRTPENNLQWTRAHAVGPYSAAELGKGLSMFVWRSKWQNPLLLPLAALALLCARRRRLVLVLAGMMVYVIGTWWLFTHRLDRFWVPVLPVVALLAGIGATWCAARLWRRILIFLLLIGLLANFLLVASAGIGDGRILVALEDLRVDLPRSQGDASRVNPVHRYLNETVRHREQVLLVGDAQPFDLEVSAIYNTCFDDCIFESWMKSHGRDERLAKLQERRVSHIYFHWGEIERYRRPENYGFTAGDENWVTEDLIDGDFVARQRILRKVDLEIPPYYGALYEVVGEAAAAR